MLRLAQRDGVRRTERSALLSVGKEASLSQVPPLRRGGGSRRKKTLRAIDLRYVSTDVAFLRGYKASGRRAALESAAC